MAYKCQDFCDGQILKAENLNGIEHGLVALDTSASIVIEATGEVISVEDAANRELQGLTLYGKTTQDGTPTPEAPIDLVNIGAYRNSIDVSMVAGKNLLGGEALADRLVKVANGTKNTEAGTIKYSAGNVSGQVIFRAFKPNTQYTLFFYGYNTYANGSKATNMRANYTDGTYDNIDFPGTAGEASLVVFVSNANKTIRTITGVNRAANSVLHYDQCGIFEGVLTEADFEPYVGHTASFSTPNGLPGIPNNYENNYSTYIDASGQRWVCDEIDYARGVYVQRVVKKVLDGSEAWNKPGGSNENAYFSAKLGVLNSAVGGVVISTHLVQKPITSSNTDIGIQVANSTAQERAQVQLRLGMGLYTTDVVKAWLSENPITILYALTEPIETPLSAEELAQFDTLHGNKTNTSAYNDVGAHMSMAYVADTKTYIDQKLAAISAAMINA